MSKISAFLMTLAFFCTIGATSSCQSNETEGVYAGVQLLINPLGGGMNKRDIVLLLRKDGSFTDALDEPDWHTAAKGKYVRTGKTLTLHYNEDDEKEEYRITDKGYLERSNYILIKMELADRIPQGAYESKSASGSGGMGTAVPYVGHFSNRNLYFDGKGNFSSSRHSVTAITGDNIGGGATSETEDGGTYTVKNGVLTFHRKNGQSSTHSYFGSLGAGKDGTMLVIDGSFYFEKKDTKDNVSGKAGEGSASEKNNKIKKDIPSAGELFDLIRSRNGGDAIDGINTMRMEYELMGLTTILYKDFQKSRTRSEVYKNGELVGVEQIEGASGWQWIKGKGKTDAQESRIKESKYSHYTGVAGLRSANAALFSKGSVQTNEEGYSISYSVDGNHFVYQVDESGTILGDAFEIDGRKQVSVYENQQTVQGIRLPFKETISVDGKKMTARIKRYDVNEPLGTDWLAPR